MSAAFVDKASAALKDAPLQEVVGRVTGLLNERRREAVAALDDYEGLRERARQAKVGILSNLKDRLLQFEARLQAQGAKVHWARDAKEAREISREILAKAGARKVVKSKSMATEEIELNHELEAGGLSVVETDLGEYVAQLKGDKPSHIILPILHLSRHKVAEVFREKAGSQAGSEVAELVEEARRLLRREFEQADAGITGANFGVASQGALCIVSNEGNARFVMSLPRVHIAVMGIEKLCADFDELSVFLRLLARSATGQRLTVYSNLVWPGRQAGDGYGARESHVILLDNGRTRLLNSPAAEMLACIRCGACLNTCPIYRHSGGHAYGTTYPGPMGSILSPALGSREGSDLAQASSLCGACKEVCPVKIDIPRLLLHYRSGDGFGKGPSWPKRLAFKAWGMAASRPALYRALTGLGRILAAGQGWVRLSWLPFGWTRHRNLRLPARQSFLQGLEKGRKP